jgi:hypothetical protein
MMTVILASNMMRTGQSGMKENITMAQRLRRQQMVQASHLNSTEQALACM